MRERCLAALLSSVAFLVSGCSSVTPLATVGHVDLPRFMGDWYVIAHIPTRLERNAHNAVESYQLAEDGTIRTTFRFNDAGFSGDLEQYEPRGFVREGSGNAVWGMQFIWPIKADFRIVYLDETYSTTIIGRNRRDYVWLMARSPAIAAPRYRELLARIEAMGYDLSQLRVVPQQW